MRWIQIDWGQACFQIGVEGGVVREAPPIARWARGKPEREIAQFFRNRGAKFRDVTNVSLTSPEALWWCPTCNGRHRLSEMQACREAGPPPQAHAQ